MVWQNGGKVFQVEKIAHLMLGDNKNLYVQNALKVLLFYPLVFLCQHKADLQTFHWNPERNSLISNVAEIWFNQNNPNFWLFLEYDKITGNLKFIVA